MSSSVLVVGSKEPWRIDVGADIVSDFNAARTVAGARAPSVVVFSAAKPKEFQAFCKFLSEKAPDAKWLVAADGLKPKQIMELINHGALFDWIDGYGDPTLIEKLQAALEASLQISQQKKLLELFDEQTRQLQRLKGELDSRVDRRHKTLRKSKQNLDSSRTRLEAFHGALTGVHRATSVRQMEQTLNESLSATLPGISVRVRFAQQSSLKPPAFALAIDIPFLENLRGEALFSLRDGRKFTAGETDFLHEVAEALALALSRLNKLDLAATLKTQWQATFDSIPHPLCLTTSDFEIVKLNLAFQQACRHHSFRELIGRNCFDVFFKPGFKPPAQQTFRATRENKDSVEHFEVSGDTMNLTHDDQAVRLILLRDITEEVRFERRIFEASKLAELGTIGSSIAHELNNPLGGILSFLQLILLDLKSGQKHFADIKSMEQATLRCRDIVQNLLSFARKQDLGDFADIELKDICAKAVKLIELQTKSKGIHIETKIGAGPHSVSASENALTQAVCNVLQNSIDAISERIAVEPLYPGRINMEMSTDDNNVYLRISDNGTGIRPEVQTRIFNPLFTTRDPGLFSGMGLTTAFTIVSEHHGSLEILSQTGSGTTAIIALPISRKTNF